MLNCFTLLRHLVVASLFALSMAACTPQGHAPLPTPTTTLSVAAARTWYQATHAPAKASSLSSAQGGTAATSPWVLDWARAIAVPGTQALVLVPLQGDTKRFANQPVRGTRYLVVAQEPGDDTPTGLLLELLLRPGSVPLDTAAVVAALYEGHRSGTLAVPQQATGSVFFYSADYQYRTGRRFVQGQLQPGTVHLGFRERNPTSTAQRGKGAVSPDGPTTNYAAPVCIDIYQILDDGVMLYVTSMGDCVNLPPPPGDGGAYGGQGDGGNGGNGGWGGTGSGHNGHNAPSTPSSVIIKPSVKNNPKANCVLSKLLENQEFKELLKNFQTSTQYNASYNMGIITNGSTGNCVWDYATSTAIITINQSDFGWQHAIWGATTFFHETYHAQLQQYAIDTFGTLVISNWPKPINNMTFQELIGYVNTTANTNMQWKAATHNYMAYNNNIMAEGLRSFVQTNYPQTYAQIGSDITKYNYLSMMGLENTTRFIDEITNKGNDSAYRQALADFATNELPDCL